jgi:hypothetical protein
MKQAAHSGSKVLLKSIRNKVHLGAASAVNSCCLACLAAFIFSRHTANRYFHRSRTDPAEFLTPFSICSFSSLSVSSLASHRFLASFRASAGSGTADGDGDGPAFLFSGLPPALTKATWADAFFPCLTTGLRFGKGAGLASGLAGSIAAGINGRGSSQPLGSDPPA